MKNFYKLLLTCLMALASCVQAFAYDFEADGIYYNILSEQDNTCQVTYQKLDRDGDPYSSYSGDIVVPSTVLYNGKSYNVTSIGKSAFRQSSKLNYVEIPTSVTSIGSLAFYECSKLSSISIPLSVCSIVSDAFLSCENLPIEDGIRYADSFVVEAVDKTRSTYTIKVGTRFIGYSSFLGCTNLTSLEIPNTVVSIGSYSFSGCSCLTSIVLSNSIMEIGESAFQGCSSLLSVELPNSIKKMGESVFSGCRNLTTVYYTATYIPGYTFQNCNSLASVIITNSITSIGERAFYKCYNISKFNIPQSVSYLGVEAFCGCSSLEYIEIPNLVRNINSYTFSGCTNLQTVVVGNSVEWIYENAFKDCSELKEIVSKNTTPPGMSSDVFDGVPKSTCVLKVPTISVNIYSTAYCWSAFTNIVPYNYQITDCVDYTESTDKNNIDITYTRTFNNTLWNPLYLPFSLSYDDWADKVSIAELSGVHFYDDGSPTLIEFITIKSGDLLPNVPYVIKPKEKGTITLNAKNKTLKAAPEEHTNFISCSSTRWTYKIYGNYKTVSKDYLDANDAKVFGISSGNLVFGAAVNDLSPFRFYLVKEKSGNGYWQETRSASEDLIYVMVDGIMVSDEEAISILGGMPEFEDGVRYNIQGVKVGKDYKGMVVVNGKKVIRK